MPEPVDPLNRAQPPDKKQALPDRISKLLRDWTRVIYALTAIVIAAITFWAVVRPLLPHSHHQLKITATCKLSVAPIAPGNTVRLTYRINSSMVKDVGLGAGIYDNQGVDHSNGFGDLDIVHLKAGLNVNSRPVEIPAHLPSGRYEVTGEIWPSNKVGANDVNTYASPTCAWFDVS